MDKRIFIAPPFGNYIDLPFATSVKGSFTWERRPGLVRQVLKTLRPTSGGFVNQIGLRNRGIRNVLIKPNHLYSVVGMTSEEWDLILDHLPPDLKLEINLGCPNGWQQSINDRQIKQFVEHFSHVCFKLPPSITLADISRLTDLGVQHVHLCNTLPTPRGGESGRRLKEVVLPIISGVRPFFPNLNITAGGGIYSFQDALDYMRAGANSLSLSTVWFNPIKGLHLAKKLDTHFKTLGKNA